MAHIPDLSDAISGFLQFKRAAGLSDHTLSDYTNSFRKLQLYLGGDPPLHTISHKHLVGFFSWLHDDYESEPSGVAPRGKKRLKPKSIENIHTGLSSLWTWAVEQKYVDEHIVRSIPRPRTQPSRVEPFASEEIKALLKATEYSREWESGQTRSKRRTHLRDRAIILTLLDTGIRNSELCGLRIEDLDQESGSLKIRGKSQGRDPKVRIVRVSPSTLSSIWSYLRTILEHSLPDDPLFIVGQPPAIRELTRGVLWRNLKRLGEKAGVRNVYPHRFRHTFAIEFLRNGGDVFTLQELLGHSTLEMVRHYARIAEIDIEKAHRRASPVRRWGLR